MTSVDKSQIQKATISLEDGSSVEVYVIPIIIPVKDVEEHLAGYDSENQYSPSAADSREIARAFLEALSETTGA